MPEVTASRTEKSLGSGTIARVCSAPVAASEIFIPVKSTAWPKPSACCAYVAAFC